MNQETNLIGQCHSEYNAVKLINSGKQHSMRVFIKRLILNTGKYYLNVIVYDKTNAKYLTWHMAAAKFKVNGDFHGGAPVQFNAEWER